MESHLLCLSVSSPPFPFPSSSSFLPPSCDSILFHHYSLPPNLLVKVKATPNAASTRRERAPTIEHMSKTTSSSFWFCRVPDIPRPRRTHLTQVLFTIIELGKQMHHIEYWPQLINNEQLKQQQLTVLYPFETKIYMMFILNGLIFNL